MPLIIRRVSPRGSIVAPAISESAAASSRSKRSLSLRPSSRAWTMASVAA
jgi:hypothetical protein